MNAAVQQEYPGELIDQDIGALLRKARSNAKLSLAEAAQQLNLSESVLRSLESNEPGDLPVAFRRGYLRSYAKVLNLDAEALVDAFNRANATDPDITPVNGVGSQRASSDPLMRWMSAAVVVVLAVMVLIWWQTKNGDSDVPTVAEGEPVQTEDAGPAAGIQPVAQALPAQEPAVPATGAAPGDAASPAPPLGAAPAPSVAAMSPEALQAGLPKEPAASLPFPDPAPLAPPASLPANGETVARAVLAEPDTPDPVPAAPPTTSPAASASDSAAAAEPTIATRSSEPVANTVAMASPAPLAERASTSSAAAPSETFDQDQLVLWVKGQTWAEVTDSDGVKLFYGLYDSPVPLRVYGNAPFSVFLGNSPAVSLHFNGDPRDQTPFNRPNNTARFSVDATGLRRP